MIYIYMCVCVLEILWVVNLVPPFPLSSPPYTRNIFNVISGGYGTVQKPQTAAGDDGPAGVHREATAEMVAQKMLAAKVM